MPNIGQRLVTQIFIIILIGYIILKSHAMIRSEIKNVAEMQHILNYIEWIKQFKYYNSISFQIIRRNNKVFRIADKLLQKLHHYATIVAPDYTWRLNVRL